MFFGGPIYEGALGRIEERRRNYDVLRRFYLFGIFLATRKLETGTDINRSRRKIEGGAKMGRGRKREGEGERERERETNYA